MVFYGNYKMKRTAHDIKAVIFDFGNVINFFNNKIFLEKMSKYTRKNTRQLYEFIYKNSGLPKKYETGLISTDEFFTELVKLCSLSITKGEFIKIFTKIFTPNEEIISLIKKLKQKYKIGLLSNTNELAYEYEIKQNEVFPLFDAVSLSYKIKAMKPDKYIYMDIVNKLKAKPRECIYIDDIKSNVDAAAKCGLCGIHYNSHQKLINTLKKLGI